MRFRSGKTTSAALQGTRDAVWRLSQRTKGRGGIDRTKYGQTRASPKSYYVHHTQQISKAAVLFDASQGCYLSQAACLLCRAGGPRTRAGVSWPTWLE